MHECNSCTLLKKRFSFPPQETSDPIFSPLRFSYVSLLFPLLQIPLERTPNGFSPLKRLPLDLRPTNNSYVLIWNCEGIKICKKNEMCTDESIYFLDTHMYEFSTWHTDLGLWFNQCNVARKRSSWDRVRETQGRSPVTNQTKKNHFVEAIIIAIIITIIITIKIAIIIAIVIAIVTTYTWMKANNSKADKIPP